MSNEMIIALAGLISRVGLDAAIIIMESLKKSTTIDEAIVALKESQQKTWADYKREPQKQ